MRRVAVIAAACLAGATLAPSIASADSGQVDATGTEDGADVGANSGAGDAAPTSSSGGDVTCEFVEAGPELNPIGYTGSDVSLDDLPAATELVEQSWYFIRCTGDGDTGPWRFFQHTPGDAPALDPISLAHRARDTLRIALPAPHTSPPEDFQQLVGLRTWLWIDAGGFQPVDASASIPGLTVTATATPTQVVWDMGDDTEPIVCTDAGTPYDTERPDDQQSTDCSHLYQWAGDYTATATVTWEITWSATNGDGGTLPPVERTEQLDLTVIERQAVIVDSP